MKYLKLFISLIIILNIVSNNSISIENKILLKLNDDIVTSIDVENEYKYLTTLNKNISNLNENEIIEIAKKSIINEKIKAIIISDNFKDLKIPEEILELILKNIYTKLDINNLEEFKKYLKERDISHENVKRKIEIEALWNELIMMKFSSKIKINEEKIRQNVINNKDNFSKSYLMSEILFEISNSKNLIKTYANIKKKIQEKGFSNAALIYSVSSTANQGGELGWIAEDSLNKNLKSILSNLKENDFTDPIKVPSGFLILKINKIKKFKNDLNVNDEVKKIINLKRNNQLNQLSKIYFNKMKKNIQINEI